MKNIVSKCTNLGLALILAAAVGSPLAVARIHLSRQHVSRAQDELKDEGYFAGRINGVAGKRTHEAIREYQRVNNLKVTGHLDQQTARSLGVARG